MKQFDNDFEIISQNGDDYCHLRFAGPFLGNLVKWDAHLYTLSYYIKELQVRGESVTSSRQFIEIGTEDQNMIPLRVGLNVNKIDQATLHKFIIMIRQYKNLNYGRHEYGQVFNLDEG